MNKYIACHIECIFPSFSAMCNPTTYGDTAIFHTLSLAWQAKCTIVNIANDDIWETRYRHDDPVDEVDFVLIYNGTNHFNAVSE